VPAPFSSQVDRGELVSAGGAADEAPFWIVVVVPHPQPADDTEPMAEVPATPHDVHDVQVAYDVHGLHGFE
jgi:hypothetical protein